MSLTNEDIVRLAKLSRISIDAGEAEKLSMEGEKILEYVAQIQELEIPESDLADDSLINVFREDVPRPISLEDREALLRAFPKRQGDYLLVPKVFDRKKKLAGEK